MKKLVIIFIGLFSIHRLLCQQGPQVAAVPFDSKSVDSWLENAINRDPRVASEQSLVSYNDFRKLLETYIPYQKVFLARSSWVGEKINTEDPNLKNDFQDEIDQPFALKVNINSGGAGYFWGDLHGDVQALAFCLKVLKDNDIINDTFEIIKPDTYFFFLGDMVDRGAHQFDMLSLILTLALKNWGKVFFIRGNHEDLGYGSDKYGFENQLKQLYKQQYPDKILSKTDLIYQSISLFYNLMPDVAFVGCKNNYLQCCHGGIEIRYNPKELLAQPSKLQYQLIKKNDENNILLRDIVLDKNKGESFNIDNTAFNLFSHNFKDSASPFFKYNFGFMWGDFNSDFAKNYNTYFDPRRGLYAGKDFTQAVLRYYSSDTVNVRGIMRAHQHNFTLPDILAPANAGVYSLWNNFVITNLSTSQFTGVIAFNKITFFDNYAEWRLTNFSSNDRNMVEEKEGVLGNWINNTPSRTISDNNDALLFNIEKEMGKINPNYDSIKQWFSEIKPDPLNKESDNYETAQKYLNTFNRFMNALNNFNKRDYALAEIDFKSLAQAPLVKYKAREYYSKTVMAAGMQDKYDEALDYLYSTVYGPDVPLDDQAIADTLLEQFRSLDSEISGEEME